MFGSCKRAVSVFGLGTVLVTFGSCYRNFDMPAVKKAPANASVPLDIAIPLSPEVAAALNGVA
ncbi:MAG: hypothetical protein HYT87_17370, partial [Nitrospirae bacterium]|nr:hypothetical protein [Nitrospirota bacterium]